MTVRIKLQQSDTARVEVELPHPDGRRRAICLTDVRGASGGFERAAAGPTGGEVRVRGVRAASAVIDQVEWPLPRGGRMATSSPAGLAGLSLELDVPGAAARGGDLAPLSGRAAITRAGARAVTLELGEQRLVLDVDARAAALELSPERSGYASADRIDLGNLQAAMAGWLVRVSSGALERARADWSGGETLLGAGAAHLAGATVTAGGVTLEVDRIELPEGVRTSGRALVIPEVRLPEIRVAVDDLVEAIRQRLPAAPAPPAGRASTESGRFHFDFGFLDRVTGRIDVDLTMELSLPVIGRREATHHFRIPIVGGALNYRELERDLAGLEDAFIDLEVRGRSLVIERRIPIIGLEKPMVIWDLSPAELELAKKRLVLLRTVPRMQIVRGGGGEKGPVTVRRLHFGNIEVQLALTPIDEDRPDTLAGLSVAKLEARGELTYLAPGGARRSGIIPVVTASSTSEMPRVAAPTLAQLAIERIAAGPFEVPVGRARVEVERVELDAIEGEVEFAAFQPRGGRLVARGAVLRNLKIIGATLLIIALPGGCSSGDDDVATVLADARPPDDAGPPGDARLGVDCKGAGCTPDEGCCGEQLEPPHTTYYCVPDDVLEGCDKSFDCDGPEDCASGLCCGGTRIECAPPGATSCSDGAAVCHTGEDCGGGPCCPTPTGVVSECIGPC